MTTPHHLETLAVIGNGIIGHGIAQIFAMARVKVILIGKSESSLATAREKIQASLAQFVAHELLTNEQAICFRCWRTIKSARRKTAREGSRNSFLA